MSQDKTEFTADELQKYISGAQKALFIDNQGYQWFNLSLNPDKPIIREKKHLQRLQRLKTQA